MRKKASLAAVLALGITFLMPGCREDFDMPGGENIVYTGTFLKVEITEAPNLISSYDLVNTVDRIATFDATFEGEDPTAEEDEPATDVVVHGYVIDYLSEDPGAPFLPPLITDYNLVVRTEEEVSVTGLLFASADQGLAFGASPDTVYQARITFDCENEFGETFEVVKYSTFVMTATPGV